MKPNPEFVKLPKSFWAAVKTVSQECGYTVRGKGTVKIPTPDEIRAAFVSLGLSEDALNTKVNGKPLLEMLGAYFKYRADTLNNDVEPLLMDATEAKKQFDALHKKLKPKCPLPMNKQKGKMKASAYLTGMVNMLIEANCNGLPVNYDPRELTTVTQNGAPLRTLSRRVDGAFPAPINPIAIWKSKNTTTPLHSAAGWRMVSMKHYWMGWKLRSWTARKTCKSSTTCFSMLVTHGGTVGKVTSAVLLIWCKWALSMRCLSERKSLIACPCWFALGLNY
jgi:hypothetical protein